MDICKYFIAQHNFDVAVTFDSGWTLLHCSAKSGNCELLQLFVDMGIDLHRTTDSGKNCLHIAAQMGRFNLCKALIEKHNFDVQKTFNTGWTALHCSAISGSYKLFKLFVDMGTYTYLTTNDRLNCLHFAAHEGHLNLCKILIEKHNFDIQKPNKKGWTALHFSVESGSYGLIKVFNDMGIDFHLTTNDDMNCLHIAAQKGHLLICKALIENHNFDVKKASNKGWTALHFSAYNGSYKLVKFFSDKGIDIHVATNDGLNCLHIAAANGHLDLCKRLIDKHKVDVQVTNKEGATALHFSSQNGNYELFEFFANRSKNVHIQTNNGVTCLHIAARYGKLNLCKILIEEYGFDVHKADNKGWTVLHFSSEYGSNKLINFFVDMGTDIYLKTNDGDNCLHIAALNGHLSLCETFLCNYNFDVQHVNNKEWTPLHCSAKSGNFSLFKYILKKGSEIYCKTKDMENVLHLSASNGHLEICKFVLEYFSDDYKDNATKKQHVLNGKSYTSQVFYKYNTIFLHAMDINGNTYLHLAANGNQNKICELLLRHSTEITTLLNKKDETARDIAKKNDYNEVLNVLKAQYDKTGMFSYVFCDTY